MPKHDDSYCESKESDNEDIHTDSEDECDSEDDDRKISEVQARGRRGTVMAAPLTVDEDWAPPVYEKEEKEVDRIKKSISNIFLFSTLDEDSLNVIIQAMKYISFDKNDTIITENDEGDLFYVIDEGSCDVLRDGEVMTEIVGQSKHNFFGELALLYDSPRAATVRATSSVEGWSLDRLTFKKIVMDGTIKKRSLYLNFLHEVPVLQSLSSSERRTLADALSVTTFKKGDVIISEDAIGDEFFIVEDGEVKCTRDGNDVYDHLGSGDYFGELALLTDEKRKATITAVRDTKCLMVDRSTFKRLLGPLRENMEENSDLYQQYRK